MAETVTMVARLSPSLTFDATSRVGIGAAPRLRQDLRRQSSKPRA
jgi:hypothetical protein